MPKKKDENELAKSIIDDIIEETESEDWNKTVKIKKAASKTPPKKEDEKPFYSDTSRTNGTNASDSIPGKER